MDQVSVAITTDVKVTAKGTATLSITAVGTNVPDKIFAIEVLPVSADSAAPILRFSNVCSAAELIELPEEQLPEYSMFRTDSISFVFESANPVEPVAKVLKQDVKRLVDELNALAAVPADTETEIIS